MRKKYKSVSHLDSLKNRISELEEKVKKLEKIVNTPNWDNAGPVQPEKKKRGQWLKEMTEIMPVIDLITDKKYNSLNYDTVIKYARQGKFKLYKEFSFNQYYYYVDMPSFIKYWENRKKKRRV